MGAGTPTPRAQPLGSVASRATDGTVLTSRRHPVGRLRPARINDQADELSRSRLVEHANVYARGVRFLDPCTSDPDLAQPQRPHRCRGVAVGTTNAPTGGAPARPYPPAGNRGGVDVRGGGPGTRDRPLDPINLDVSASAASASGWRAAATGDGLAGRRGRGRSAEAHHGADRPPPCSRPRRRRPLRQPPGRRVRATRLATPPPGRCGREASAPAPLARRASQGYRLGQRRAAERRDRAALVALARAERDRRARCSTQPRHRRRGSPASAHRAPRRCAPLGESGDRPAQHDAGRHRHRVRTGQQCTRPPAPATTGWRGDDVHSYVDGDVVLCDGGGPVPESGVGCIQQFATRQ